MDSFQQLGVCEELASACTSLGWKSSTPIQSEAIPLALDGKDIIGLAQTGSGKTGAFAIPILQALLKSPRPFFACIICPTRELARQIAEQFEALGSGIGLTCATIIGGIDMISQAIALGRRPHIVVATPGRLVDHLSNTKGFNLQNLKYLVLDEADRILDSDYEDAVNQILENIPKERNTYLFSATMTNKVAKLQRACLRKPAKVVVSSKYSTVDTLKQELLFIPFNKKDFYLIYLLHEMAGSITMVFTRTCESTRRLALLLRNLGLAAIPISGQMSQEKRLGALTKFKSGERNILVCTDVASRGLDIPNVDLVVNFDMPSNSKDYIHRVGRTARAGRAGRAILFASQYDIEQHCRLENALGKRLPSLVIQEDEVNMLKERVLEAQRLATMHMREQDAGKKKRHKLADADDDGYLAGRKLQKGRPFYVK